MRHIQLCSLLNWDISASVVTARILSYFGFPSLSFTKSAGSVSVAGPLKLRWFSHPIQYYLHMPNVSIYRWSSNFVNLSSCWIEKGAISSNLPCVFIVWRDNFIQAFVTKLNVETKGKNNPTFTHTNNVILQCGTNTEPGSLVFDLAKVRHNRPFALVDHVINFL